MLKLIVKILLLEVVLDIMSYVLQCPTPCEELSLCLILCLLGMRKVGQKKRILSKSDLLVSLVCKTDSLIYVYQSKLNLKNQLLQS